jgi:pimeloyl-ACP methyl ester carboxylesterase
MARVEFDEKLKPNRLAFMAEGPPDDRLSTGFVWLGGFMSEMTGTKAESLSALSRSTRRAFLRFDYAGHGQSAGTFTDYTISDWLEQSTHMFLTRTSGRRILIGSSMGGWLALLMLRKLLREDPAAVRRVVGLVLIAPAADMTQDLMWEKIGDAEREQLRTYGVYHQPTPYGDPYAITLRLLEDGMKHLILEEGLHLPVPVRILQGTHDTDVPMAHAMKTMDALSGDDIAMTVIKGGDHRLSTPLQLRLIQETVMALANRADGITL